jgi:hypothetical protein
MRLVAGDQVTFSLTSDDVDVLARVEGPDGQTWEDDDSGGDTNALLHFTAPVDGVYRFIATTYGPGTTGSFHVTVDVAPSDLVDDDDGDDGDDSGLEPGEDPGVVAPSAGGSTFGIFVGISDQGGENSFLPGSADDAVQLASAFAEAGWMQRTNAVVLTDARATVANVRQAFGALSQRMGPGDTLVFFYDGHGSTQVLDTRGPDLSRAELGRLLDRVPGRSLVVLDSCEAGGFAPVVQRPGRFGLFSSRADENSSTAPEVNAGGWLAYFFREAVRGGVPRGADGSVDYARVVRYVQQRYDRQGVSQHQHLVAVNGTGSDTFALGGSSQGPALQPGTAIATNNPPAQNPGLPGFGGLPAMNGLPNLGQLGQLPAMVNLPAGLNPQSLGGLFGIPSAQPSAAPAAPTVSMNELGQLFGAGVNVMSQVASELTK